MIHSLSAKVTSPKTIEVIKVNLPKLKDSQVLLRVLSCGVCSSEIPVYTGEVIGTPGASFRYKDYPADIGHEVVGEVIEIGSKVKGIDLGSFVTGLTYSGCGFSEYFIEEAKALVTLSSTDRHKCSKIIGEPLMATVNIIRQMQVGFGDSIVVVGDGFMSLLLIAGLSRYPISHLIVVGHHENRLNIAKKYGATHCINSKNEDPWEIIMEQTSGIGTDISVEYAGNTKTLQLAASICKAKQRSKLVLASAYPNDQAFAIGNYLQNRAPVLIPAYPNHSPNPMADMRQGIWGYENGIFPIDELITNQYPLKKITGAFEDCINRRDHYIKGIVTPHLL